MRDDEKEEECFENIKLLKYTDYEAKSVEKNQGSISICWIFWQRNITESFSATPEWIHVNEQDFTAEQFPVLHGNSCEPAGSATQV